MVDYYDENRDQSRFISIDLNFFASIREEFIYHLLHLTNLFLCYFFLFYFTSKLVPQQAKAQL